MCVCVFILGSLRSVYGQSSSGSSANTASLFTDYPAGSSAVTYFKLGHTPVFYSLQDYSAEQRSKCTLPHQAEPLEGCMHDWKVTGQESYGLLALENHKEYRQLKQILGSYSTGDNHSFEIQYGAG